MSGGLLVALAAGGVGLLLWKAGAIPGTAAAKNAAAKKKAETDARVSAALAPVTAAAWQAEGGAGNVAGCTGTFSVISRLWSDCDKVDATKATIDAPDVQKALARIKALGALAPGSPLTITRMDGSHATTTPAALIAQWQAWINSAVSADGQRLAPPESPWTDAQLAASAARNAAATWTPVATGGSAPPALGAPR